MRDYAGSHMASGRDVALARVRGVDDNMVRPHRHDYFEIYVIESGSRYHWGEHTLFLIEPPELIIFPPGVEHFSYADDGIAFQRVVVYFHAAAVLYPHVLEAIRDEILVFRPEGAGQAGVRGVVEQLLAAQDGTSESAQDEMRLLVTQLLVKTLDTKRRDARTKRREGRMADVLRYLHDHFTGPIELGTLAEQFFISPYYLSREFKKHTGSTVIGYVNRVRIGQAERLLEETSLPVCDIAAEVGFANVAHFNRVFRAQTGTTPSSVRARCRAETA